MLGGLTGMIRREAAKQLCKWLWIGTRVGTLCRTVNNNRPVGWIGKEGAPLAYV